MRLVHPPQEIRSSTPSVWRAMRRLRQQVAAFMSLITGEEKGDSPADAKEVDCSEANAASRLDALRRIVRSPHYSPSSSRIAPYGFYCGRPIIGDGAPITGGIYLSKEAQEAVVVDGKYDVMQKTLQEFKVRLSGLSSQKKVADHAFLKFTMAFAREVFTLDATDVIKLNRALGGQHDKKVALDSYIAAGCAEPRHMVLLAGFLIEHCISEQIISGVVTIDTSQPAERLVYTAGNGDLFVVDFTHVGVEAGH